MPSPALAEPEGSAIEPPESTPPGNTRPGNPPSENTPTVATEARDTEPEEAPHAERRAARDSGLAMTGRFAMMTSGVSNQRLILAPALGLGLEHFFNRNLGLALRYDASTATRGTSALSVRRLMQQLVLTAEGRVRLHPALSLHAGVGAGGALLLARTSFLEETHTATSLELGLAGMGSFDVDIPDTALRATFGVSGLVHRSSRDLLYFAGFSLSL